MIVGAGFAGLITAHIFPKEAIFEAAAAPIQNHKALLRFRTDSVSKLTGIVFRKVRVRKGIWHEGSFVEPDIQLANSYSTKCLGRLVGDRSIWNLDAVDRYIAPETLYEELIDTTQHRIVWGSKATYDRKEVCINTAPLPSVLSALNLAAPVAFEREAITTLRFRVPRCDVHQTVYYPTDLHTLYRASITSNLLICEFAGDPEGEWEEDLNRSFSLFNSYDKIDSVKQSYGKIAPIDEKWRKRLVYDLTTNHHIFSVGRFATWRNILLDDVVEDAAVVKRLIHASNYERQLSLI